MNAPSLIADDRYQTLLGKILEISLWDLKNAYQELQFRAEDPEYREWLDLMLYQMEIFKFILTRFPNIGDTMVSKLRTPSEVDP